MSRHHVVQHQALFAALMVVNEPFRVKIDHLYAGAPERLLGQKVVLLKNPFTGHRLWLGAEYTSAGALGVKGQAVVAVLLPIQYSNRRRRVNGLIEVINPTTGNTLAIHPSAIKETP